jgi:hypothetical protein
MTTERKTNDKGQTLTFSRWTPDAYFGEGGGFVAAYLDGAPVADINARRNDDGTWKVWVQDNAGYMLEAWNDEDEKHDRRLSATRCFKALISRRLGFGGYRTAWGKGARARLAKKHRDEDASRAWWEEYDARVRAERNA